MSFKDNWNKVDETCPSCNQVTKRVRGITKQNLKRLLKPKFDMNEMMITIIIIMVILLAYTYMKETRMCREWIKPMFQTDYSGCMNISDNYCRMVQGIVVKRNITQYNFTAQLTNITGEA